VTTKAGRSTLTATSHCSPTGTDGSNQGTGRILVPLMVVPEARKEIPENLLNLRRQLRSEV
jgi:hypothetical protein